MIYDYKQVGFKAGIEIHQQLEGHKLFSRAPTTILKEVPDYTVRRILRATGSETGSIDKAAIHEQKKAKTFAYLGYYDSTSLVELDEEPPQPLNQDALRAAIQIAKMLNCKIIDQVHIMRKIVIDGSNTSGFQRTMLIGMNGYVELNGRKIGIETVCLEEEAGQAIQRTKEEDTYNLSRLGIPLIEIATSPDLKTPLEVRECANHIGMILRSTGACKRGIGSIRQDLNMSITNSQRIEIKGFQDLRSIESVLDLEITRQKKLIDANDREESHVRKAEADGSTSYLRPMPGSARMYPETDIVPFIPDVKNVKIPKLLNEVSADLEKIGIPKDLATIITKKELPIQELIESYPQIEPKFLADVLVSMPKELKKRYEVDVEDISTLAKEALEKFNQGKINQEAVIEAVVILAQGKKVDWTAFAPLDEKDVEEKIASIVKNNPNASSGMLMGLVMKELRGKIQGKKVMEIIEKQRKQ